MCLLQFIFLLRLWDEKRPMVALDMDELIDSREITITVSDDGNFMPTFTCTVGVPKRNVAPFKTVNF
jgi:hypothetical protein